MTQKRPSKTTTETWNAVQVPDRVAERAHELVEVDEAGCWISLYSVGSHGYAQIGWQDAGTRHMVLAHRASWVHEHGQVPLGITLDHTCRQRRCVNPGHLRLLSNVENARRTNGADFPLGGCRNGHPDSELVPITRRNKAGIRRTGLTCGVCVQESRARWLEANPEKRRATLRRYDEKRKAVA